MLSEVAETDRERRLQKALRRSETLVEHQRSRMVQMQASTVLTQKYCDRLRTQLENQEEKKKKAKGKNK